MWLASGGGLSLCYVKEKCGVSRGNTSSPQSVNGSKPYLFLTPIMDTTRASYSGTSRKLVVALDIGTTFSGAAYALLAPGEVPQIQYVTRQAFPPVPDLVKKVMNGRYLNNPNPG